MRAGVGKDGEEGGICGFFLLGRTSLLVGWCLARSLRSAVTYGVMSYDFFLDVQGELVRAVCIYFLFGWSYRGFYLKVSLIRELILLSMLVSSLYFVYCSLMIFAWGVCCAGLFFFFFLYFSRVVCGVEVSSRLSSNAILALTPPRRF